jgi:hypothetical protein
MNTDSLQELLNKVQIEFPGCTKPVIIIRTTQLDIDEFNKNIKFAPTINIETQITEKTRTINYSNHVISLIFPNGRIQIEQNGE